MPLTGDTKASTNAQHAKALSDALYYALGVPMISALPADRAQHSEADIHVKDEPSEIIRRSARQYFVAHALLGNMDVANLDHFTVYRGEAYFNNADTNFLFDAKGKERTEAVDLLTDLDNMQDASKNKAGHGWFSDLSDEELATQARDILSRQKELSAVIWREAEKLNMSPQIREQYISAFARRMSVLADRFQIKEQSTAQPDAPAIAHQTAAGILTYTMIDGKAHVLLSKRERKEGWDNFGGKSERSDKDPSLLHTAIREVAEESNDLLHYTEYDLTHSPFHDLVNKKTNGPFTYRMYLVEHDVIDTTKLHDKEHSEHLWMPVEELLNIVKFPDGQKINLFEPFLQMLNQKPVQNHLERLNQNLPLKKTHTRGGVNEIPSANSHAAIIDTLKTRREQMADVLIKHSSVVRELKKKNAVTSVVNHRLPDNRLSPSELHLKVVLADKWTDNLEKDVRSMIDLYFPGNEKFVPGFVQMIEQEKNTGDSQFHFYHGCDSQIAFAYDIYTTLYETLHASNEWPVFRAKAGIFSQFHSVDAFIDHFSSKGGKVNNNAEGFNELAYAANVFLFGNHEISTSCSVSYMLTDSTRRKVNLEAMLNDLLEPFDMNKQIIKELLKVYDTFASKQGGALYQVGMPRDAAERLSYASGVLGVVTAHEGSKSLPNIMDKLTAKGTKLTPESKTYIQGLQARVIADPTMATSRRTIHENELADEEKKNYVAKRKQVVNKVAYHILIYLAAMNQEQFGSTLALLRIQRSLARDYQLPAAINLADAEGITPKYLAQAIVKNSASVVMQLLTKYPEWKELTLELPAEQSYFDSESRSKNKTQQQNMSALQMIICHSNLETKLIVACFGQDWQNLSQLRLANDSQLAKVLIRLPDEIRSAFAKKWERLITNSDKLDNILPLLPDNERVAYAELHSQKISNADDLWAIIILLPITQRLEFVEKHNELLSGLFGNIISELPDDRELRLAFFQKYKHRINDGESLASVMENIPSEFRLPLAEELSHKIKNGIELGCVLKELLPHEKLSIAEKHMDTIEDGYQMAFVIKRLEQDQRFPIVKSLLDKISDIDECQDVAQHLNAKDAQAMTALWNEQNSRPRVKR